MEAMDFYSEPKNCQVIWLTPFSSLCLSLFLSLSLSLSLLLSLKFYHHHKLRRLCYPPFTQEKLGSRKSMLPCPRPHTSKLPKQELGFTLAGYAGCGPSAWLSGSQLSALGTGGQIRAQNCSITSGRDLQTNSLPRACHKSCKQQG